MKAAADNKPDVFKALADPTRREILRLLLKKRFLTIHEVVERFPASRQGVSKHLHYLADAGLVVMEHKGRTTYCVPQPKALSEVKAYLKELDKFWEESLDKLEAYLDGMEE